MEQLLAVPAKRILNSKNLVSISERAVDTHTGCDWSAAVLEMGPGDQTGQRHRRREPIYRARRRPYRRTEPPLPPPRIVFAPFPVPGHLLSVRHWVQMPPVFPANLRP